jgi:hypothetical protein
MLTKRENPHTGRTEWCLVSISSGKVLEWFGPKEPSDGTVKKSEERVQWFKHKGEAGGK